MWSDVISAALVWAKTSGWRKASKCKSLIKQVQVHLTTQKNRRDAIMQQSRHDIAQLLQNGELQHAIARVEQLYKDQCLLAAYDQIDHFCVCLNTNISHICKQSTVENLHVDVIEAVASLTYAASRCGEFPELQLLRNLFKDRYGSAFDETNVELSAGNFVNFQLKKNLCIGVVPDHDKMKLISEIAHEYTLISPESVSSLTRNRTFASPGIQFHQSCGRNLMGNNDHFKMLEKDRRSFDSSINKLKARSEKSCLSHVHPKLPVYEDVVAKLKDQKKAEVKQRKSCSIY